MYSWWWVELSPETCRVKPLRRINAIVASCWNYFTIKHDARNRKYEGVWSRVLGHGNGRGYSMGWQFCLLFIDKWREEIFSSSRIEFSQWKICSRNMRVLRRLGMYRDERHLKTQFHGRLKDIFWGKWLPKLKNQNLGEGVLCVKGTEKKKRKLQCTAAKYVMLALAWKITLNCITRRSIIEVMTIILLLVYSFKISLLKF